MPRNEVEIVRCARAIARLQSQGRKLRRQLKALKKDLALERKHMRALIQIHNEPDADVVPSRVFGEGIGLARGRDLKVVNDTPRPTSGDPDPLGLDREEDK
jgi:hypothetical protein